MWWWLLGALCVGALITVSVVGTINKEKARQKLQQNQMNDAIVEAVNRNTNEVKLKDLKSGQEMLIQGDAVSSELRVGSKIYC